MKYYLSLIILFVVFQQHTIAQNGSCTTCPVLLPEGSVGTILLPVQNAQNPTLGTNNQGPCQISINFNHAYIGDMVILLESPSGQSIYLLSPIGLYGETDLSTWDIDFLPCADTVFPDTGYQAVFSNNENWGMDNHFSGSYYPNVGCLEDFNEGPVNGNWKLHWYDEQPMDNGIVYDASLTFCDTTGINSVVSTQVIHQAISKDAYIAPNPIHQNLNLYFPNRISENSRLAIFSTDGKMMLAQKDIHPNNSDHVSIDVNHFPKGIYLVKIWHNTDFQTLRFVK